MSDNVFENFQHDVEDATVGRDPDEVQSEQLEDAVREAERELDEETDEESEG